MTDSDARKKSNSLEIPAAAKHDLNLVLRSCFVLSRKDQRREVVRRWKAPDSDGVVREFEIVIKSADRLPWFRDNEILMVFITKAQRENKQEIELSEYEVLKWLGLSSGGKNYQGLRSSIDRLVGVMLRGTFWVRSRSKGKWREYTKWGHLLDTAEIITAGDEETGTQTVQGLKVRLSNLIWADIQSGNLLTFDWTEYQALEGDSVKAIYLYVNSVNASQWEVDIFQLAETHLGMGIYQHPSKVWEKLKPMLEAAQEQGIISHFERVKRGRYTRVLLAKEIKQLTFFDKPASEVDGQLVETDQQDEPASEKEPQQTDQPKKVIKKQQHSSGEPVPNNHVVTILTNKGISHQVATRLAHRYNEARVLEKVDFLQYLQDNQLSGGIKSPQGWLRRAIEDDYAPPTGYTPQWQEQQTEKRNAKESVRQEKEVVEAAQMAEIEQKRIQWGKTRDEQLKRHRAHYGASEREESIWSGMLAHIRVSDDTGVKVFLAGSELLSLANNQVVIWLANDHSRYQTAQRYELVLKRLAAKTLGSNFQDIEVTYITPTSLDDSGAGEDSTDS